MISLKARFVAGFLALLALASWIFVPLCIVRGVMGVGLGDVPGPAWEIYWLTLGGGLGIGLASYVHHHVLTRFFSVPSNSATAFWARR